MKKECFGEATWVVGPQIKSERFILATITIAPLILLSRVSWSTLRYRLFAQHHGRAIRKRCKPMYNVDWLICHLFSRIFGGGIFVL